MINKKLIAMVPETKPYILNKVGVNWLSLMVSVVLWFTIGGVVEQLVNNTLDLRELTIATLIVLICTVIKFICTYLSSILTYKVSESVKLTLREKIYDKLHRLGANYTNDMQTSEAIQLGAEGVELLETYFGLYLPQLAYSMLAPITLFIIYMTLSPITAIILFMCVPLIPLAIISVQKLAKKLLKKYWGAYTGLGDTFLENLQGLTTLKIYGVDHKRHLEMDEDAEQFRKVTMRVLTMQLNSLTIMDIIAYGGTGLGIIACSRVYMNGEIHLMQAIAMILLAGEFFLALRRLGSYFHVAMNGVAASDKMFRLLDSQEQHEGECELESADIKLKNVCFSYDNEVEQLKNINITIKQGEWVSLVGESGSGKSTLANILSGLKLGYKGNIEVGDVELAQATQKSIYNTITLIRTGSYIFSGTLRDILLEGKADATDLEMEEVLRLLKLYDFVKEQGGLEMKISEGGSNLSGGQRQRLALARALLKKSDIYIFDEATSNIDVESEEAILNVIKGLVGQHTVIMISHRLLNVVESDRVYLLKEGELVEEGSHTELIQQEGIYKKMFAYQYQLENYRGGENDA